jgi:hypothetical protein
MHLAGFVIAGERVYHLIDAAAREFVLALAFRH